MKIMLSLCSWVFLVFGLGACVTEMVEDPASGKNYVMKEIDKIITRLPFETEKDLYVDLRRLIAYDQFAVQPMMECLDSMNAKVRSSAAFVLGQLKAEQSVDPLLDLMLEDENRLVRYEAARAILEIGAWDSIPVLIEGLDDNSLFVRNLCYNTLEGKTGESFDYVPNGPDEERLASVSLWRAWWVDKENDPNTEGNFVRR